MNNITSFTSIGIFSEYIDIAKSTKRDIFYFNENYMICFDEEYGSASKIIMKNNYTKIPFMFNNGIFSPTYIPMKNFIESSAKKECSIFIKDNSGYIIPSEYISIVLNNEIEFSDAGFLIDKNLQTIVPYVSVEVCIPNVFLSSVYSLFEIENMFNKTLKKLTIFEFEKREDYKEMYKSKVTDGTFRFNINNSYMMLLYKSFLPTHANDKIDLEIIYYGENKFCTHFVIHRKINKSYNDMHIYSFMLNVI